MTGNTIGKIFKVTSFGESHGPFIGCVIDGCPPGFAVTNDRIQQFLNRRRPGQSKYTSQRREEDIVEIISGVFEGLSTGAPIALLIKNTDSKSRDYEEIKDLFRPGHADFTYFHKYGHRDYRGGGRSSARETVARVAAGAVALLYLKEYFAIEVFGFMQQIGNIPLKFEDVNCVNKNPFFCPNVTQISDLENYIDEIRKKGDSIGARVGVIARNVPIGLGEPVFDKLDANIAYAMMSINAVKGVEIGAGFNSTQQLGSEHRDEMDNNGFLSNNSGGILGGISTGQDITVSVAFKPTSSIVLPGKTITTKGESAIIKTKGRHDPCVGMRAVPIVEAMLGLVLMDNLLLSRALLNNKGFKE